MLTDLARVGLLFELQRQVEHLLSWRTPTHTMSLMIVYSFICLDPYLLAVIPFAVILILVMVPAFLTRHPPPPSTSTSSTVPYYSYHGPALAPARNMNPAPESSKDFFRNMRDLQNSMADLSDLHDATVAVAAPMTDFSNENISSMVFLLFLFAAFLAFLTVHLIPWRFVFLFAGNIGIISIHPEVQDVYSSMKADSAANRQGPIRIPTEKEKAELLGKSFPSSPSGVLALLDSSSVHISLDTHPEEREVEIFELQYRSLSPYTTEAVWEHFVFTPTPYEPLSPARIAGERPRGCRFFEDIRPPAGWTWKDRRWELDLHCHDWVVERMISGVGFELSDVMDEEGACSHAAGGWVWDVPTESQESQAPSRDNGGDDDDDVVPTLAYGDLQDQKKGKSQPEGNGSRRNLWGKLKDKSKPKNTARDWEEKVIGPDGMGEWRRRRWVRIVHRVSLQPSKEKGEKDRSKGDRSQPHSRSHSRSSSFSSI